MRRPNVLVIAKQGLASLVPQPSHVSWGTRLGLAGGCQWWQVGAGWGEKGGKQEGSLIPEPPSPFSAVICEHEYTHPV